jgi:hypothetical protein
MERFIHLPAGERRLVFEQAAAEISLPAQSIEKDFWVCWTLRRLFFLPTFGPHLTFKGGTSLSKAWKLIERFSEDIDIIIDRKFLGFGNEHDPEQAPSKGKRKERIEELKDACQGCIHGALRTELEEALRTHLPTEEAWELKPDVADPDEQTLLFVYPSAWSPAAGRYVHPSVKIEMGARSDDWPAQDRTIRSYVAEALPRLFQDNECVVRVLAAERTFWEKATLLHEETFRPAEKQEKRKARLSRHYYDLWCMVRAGVAERAASELELFERVVEHRKAFFPYSWVDYSTMKKGTLRLVPTSEQLGRWRRDYEAMREEMFFGEPPTFDEVMALIAEFERQWNQ